MLELYFKIVSLTQFLFVLVIFVLYLVSFICNKNSRKGYRSQYLRVKISIAVVSHGVNPTFALTEGAGFISYITGKVKTLQYSSCPFQLCAFAQGHKIR